MGGRGEGGGRFVLVTHKEPRHLILTHSHIVFLCYFLLRVAPMAHSHIFGSFNLLFFFLTLLNTYLFTQNHMEQMQQTLESQSYTRYQHIFEAASISQVQRNQLFNYIFYFNIYMEYCTDTKFLPVSSHAFPLLGWHLFDTPF